MEKQYRFISSLYAVVFALFVVNVILVNLPKTYKYRSPLTDGINVLAAGDISFRKNYIIYGFLPYWKLDEAKYLQMDKLTDIAFFGLGINRDGSIRKLDHEGNIDPGYNKWKNSEALNDLIARAANTGTRMAVTVVGHDADISDYFLFCESCWVTFGDDLEKEMLSKGITNVNFDFEYGDVVDEKTADQYTKLVAYINDRLDKKFGESFVTVSTFADSFTKSRVTNADDLSHVSDALFIMAYDFHRPNSDNAGPIAPIDGIDVYSNYDLSTMLKDYLKNIPPNKLIMGVPYYGYNWVVNSPVPYAERVQGSDLLGYSVSQTYEKVNDTILEIEPTVLWDDLAKAPYFSYVSPETGSSRLVYFENTRSLTEKYKLAKESSLAGVGIWALGYDGGYQELWQLLDEEFVQ